MDLANILNATFFFALLNIIFINIILSGDNAVVIAMAVRSLPDKQRQRGIILGTAVAVILRIGLTFVAAKLLDSTLRQACRRPSYTVDRFQASSG